MHDDEDGGDSESGGDDYGEDEFQRWDDDTCYPHPVLANGAPPSGEPIKPRTTIPVWIQDVHDEICFSLSAKMKKNVSKQPDCYE